MTTDERVGDAERNIRRADRRERLRPTSVGKARRASFWWRWSVGGARGALMGCAERVMGVVGGVDGADGALGAR